MNERMAETDFDDLFCGLGQSQKLNTAHLHKLTSALYSIHLFTVMPIFSGSHIMASTSVHFSLLYFQEAIEARSAESR